uniref:Cellulase 5 n=1 Tax=Mesosa myops TaxID=993118 RepID=A0A0X8DE19_9CUCU|nr:cellulase 5 [Mesosa myops]
MGLVLVCAVNLSVSKDAAQETVSKHGQLSVSGVHLVDKNGDKVQLKGMSLFWDVWKPQYYNKQSIDGVHSSCHANIVRAAIAAATDDGGYVTTPEKTLERLYAVIDAAIADDIYVLVDWHDHAADTHLNYSLKFFDTVSKKYSGVPNILYETFNEPIAQSWDDVVKPYHQAVIKTIRANEPNNIIILGSPKYSTGIDQPAGNPITGQKNIMYTLHFYAGTSDQGLRDLGTRVLNGGLPIFVTEYGTVNGDGDGPVDTEETRLWYEWLDKNSISHVNWAISDKQEGASALVPNTAAADVCKENFLTESGKLVVAHNKA